MPVDSPRKSGDDRRVAAVVMQGRAVQTRQKIMDTAVKLFADSGYLETDVKAITRAADLTPGAFYYHYASKEALVVEIIAEGWSRIWSLITARLDAAEPGLENVITTTLAQAERFANDDLVWVAVQLNQAFGQLSRQGRRVLRQQFDEFIAKVAENIPCTDIREDLTPQDVGELIWIMLQGSAHLPGSDEPVQNLIPRTVKNLAFLLRAIVPPESLPRFERILTQG